MTSGDPQHISTRESYSRVLHWYLGQNITSCKETALQIAEFFLYLHRELKFTIPAVKVYRSALNHVIALACTDLEANKIISRMFSNFKKSCPPREVKPLNWNLSLVHKSLTHPLYEP